MTLQFTPEWKTTLLALLLLPLLMRLGFWQLEREQEKRDILADYTLRQSQPPLDINTLWQGPADQLAFLPVRMRGVFDQTEVYLLDNKTRQGRVGFEVIQKLQLAYPNSGGDDTHRTLWVNRGWIAAGARRDDLPPIVTPVGEQTLFADVYVPQGETFKLAADSATASDWPRVIQQLETVFVHAADTAEAGFPYSVRLNSDSPAALVTDWQAVNVQPLKHRGYAIQWFAMAAALFIFYIFMSSNLMDVLRRSR